YWTAESCAKESAASSGNKRELQWCNGITVLDCNCNKRIFCSGLTCYDNYAHWEWAARHCVKLAAVHFGLGLMQTMNQFISSANQKYRSQVSERGKSEDSICDAPGGHGVIGKYRGIDE